MKSSNTLKPKAEKSATPQKNTVPQKNKVPQKRIEQKIETKTANKAQRSKTANKAQRSKSENIVTAQSAKNKRKKGAKKKPLVITPRSVLANRRYGSHILVKYLIKELSLYFIVAFLFFFMLFFVNQILLTAEEILKKQVPIPDVVMLITYSLPFLIAQSAPFATFVGFLMCIGRLATDNETLIFRASGRSYGFLLAPVITLGLLISFVSFFVNDYLLPLANISYNNLYQSIVLANPAVELESNSVKQTKNSTLVIGDVFGKDVSDLIFFDIDEEGKQRIIVSGPTIVVKPNDRGVLMQLEMSNPSVIMFNGETDRDYDFLNATLMRMNIFNSEIFDTDNLINPREYTSWDLYFVIQEMKESESSSPLFINWYEMEFNKKFSLPFGALFFAFLAFPISLIFGRHNGQTIGFVVGIIVCFIYWTMLILGQNFSSRSGEYGVISMWLPDSLLLISGIFFYIALRGK
ncbi:MAG: LptF/LptG family permease [Treponemataceae bacterium]|nr:MAG: LptF/LptG family permease [Treponemataceae bacterium]